MGYASKSKSTEPKSKPIRELPISPELKDLQEQLINPKQSKTDMRNQEGYRIDILQDMETRYFYDPEENPYVYNFLEMGSKREEQEEALQVIRETVKNGYDRDFAGSKAMDMLAKYDSPDNAVNLISPHLHQDYLDDQAYSNIAMSLASVPGKKGYDACKKEAMEANGPSWFLVMRVASGADEHDVTKAQATKDLKDLAKNAKSETTRKHAQEFLDKGFVGSNEKELHWNAKEPWKQTREEFMKESEMIANKGKYQTDTQGRYVVAYQKPGHRTPSWKFVNNTGNSGKGQAYDKVMMDAFIRGDKVPMEVEAQYVKRSKPGKKKEPWQMTYEEWSKNSKGTKKEHRDIIYKAYTESNAIPPNVLRQYKNWEA